jgi:RNA polymerase primary sigma factor
MGEDHLVNQAVQRVCEAAEQIGEITFDQLNALLPATQFTPEQIEQFLNRLSEKGIQLVED